MAVQGPTVGDVVAWVNVELTKTAAEIGYARFLYAVQSNPRSANDTSRPPATTK